MMQRMLALLRARNMEFLHDRSSLGWNIAFPLLLVFGLAAIFSGGERPLFKVSILQPESANAQTSDHPFLNDPYIDFVTVGDEAEAIQSVRMHRTDLLFDPLPPRRYWVNPESQKGHYLETVLLANSPSAPERVAVTGAPIRLIDWLMPGILGMNMMFSCLFGVGYVVVRYRKNGFLKRLNATPAQAFEFLLAQILSRLLLIMVMTVGVYVGADLFLDFRMQGSYLLLAITGGLGAMSLISMGLMVAARANSEELAGGLLNFITWPMMVLSELWFSMEGSPQAIIALSKALPMTHLMQASRAIMLEGAGAAEIMPSLIVLAAMSLLFLLIGTWLFRWRAD